MASGLSDQGDKQLNRGRQSLFRKIVQGMELKESEIHMQMTKIQGYFAINSKHIIPLNVKYKLLEENRKNL